MSEYLATVAWSRAKDEAFTDDKYSRGHEWRFDGGVVVPASASPHIVPAPYSVEANVDPEEAFVASLSSCHMLFFLSIAGRKKYCIDAYIDNAVGVLERGAEGRMAMTRVTLRPQIKFSGDNRPDEAEIVRIHHKSHQLCFIANSVKTDVVTEPMPYQGDE